MFLYFFLSFEHFHSTKKHLILFNLQIACSVIFKTNLQQHSHQHPQTGLIHGELSTTCRFGVDGGVGVSGRVCHTRRPPPPEEAAQDATFQRLQQGALSSSRVSKQLQFDPGLDGLSGTQLLDVAQFVVVLITREKR